jgi:hypothetical protein
MGLTTDPNDPRLSEKRPDGQQKAYRVLTDAELRKGFVRPVRFSYRHIRCGAITTMHEKIAETYARDPQFYGGTFCSTCCNHFPVGPDGEFLWTDDDTKVGT